MSTTYNPNRPPTHQHLKGNTLKSFATVAISVGALASAAGTGRRCRRSSGGSPTVDQTVSQLQAGGYEVILNKVGTAPLISAPSVRSDPARPTPEPIPVYRGPAMTWSPP